MDPDGGMRIRGEYLTVRLVWLGLALICQSISNLKVRQRIRTVRSSTEMRVPRNTSYPG